MTAARQDQMRSLMREVLGESYFSLEVRGLSLEEDVAEGRSVVRAKLVDPRSGDEREIQGSGVGLVDAAFDALVTSLVDEYPSLAHIRFRSFKVDGDTGTGEKVSRTDSEGVVRLEVDNQVNRTFVFTDASRSVSASCVRVTLAAVEYFVNSERAFLQVRGLLEDARGASRPDLVDRYTQMLSQLVENASYADSLKE